MLKLAFLYWYFKLSLRKQYFDAKVSIMIYECFGLSLKKYGTLNTSTNLLLQENFHLPMIVFSDEMYYVSNFAHMRGMNQRIVGLRVKLLKP
jgi:hypothetical protein